MATDAQVERALRSWFGWEEGNPPFSEKTTYAMRAALLAAFPTAAEYASGIEAAAAGLPKVTGEFNPFLAPRVAGVDEISLEAQRETWREKARAAVGPWLRVAMRMEPPVEEAKND